jgi:hypothetical protein
MSKREVPRKASWNLHFIILLARAKIYSLVNKNSARAKLFGFYVIRLWEMMKPMVEGARKQWRVPKSLEWFEYLYNEMKKREQKLHRYRGGSLDYDRVLGLGQQELQQKGVSHG